MNINHWIAHKLGWNYGVADSFYIGDRQMMSFKCTGCGKRSGVHEVTNQVDRWLKEDTK